jgi:hypothetical protein
LGFIDEVTLFVEEDSVNELLFFVDELLSVDLDVVLGGADDSVVLLVLVDDGVVDSVVLLVLVEDCVVDSVVLLVLVKDSVLGSVVLLVLFTDGVFDSAVSVVGLIDVVSTALGNKVITLANFVVESVVNLAGNAVVFDISLFFSPVASSFSKFWLFPILR